MDIHVKQIECHYREHDISFRGILRVIDIGYYFVKDQIDGTPWGENDKLWWHSPLKYADKVKNQLLTEPERNSQHAGKTSRPAEKYIRAII